MSERSDRRAAARREEIRARRAQGQRGARRPVSGRVSGVPRKKKRINWFRVTVIAVGVALVLLILLGIVNAIRGAQSGDPAARDDDFFATIRPDATAAPATSDDPTASEPGVAAASGVLFVGDSMTEQLADYVATHSSTLSNAAFATADGYSWTRAASEAPGSGTLSLDGETVTLSEAVAKANPAELYIMLGMNDLITTDYATVSATADAVLSTLSAAYPNLKITVQAMTPMISGISYQGLGNSSISNLNGALEEICEENTACSFADLSVLFPDGSLPLDSCADSTQLCIHLNDAGCALWADYILNGPPEPTASPEPSESPDSTASAADDSAAA